MATARQTTQKVKTTKTTVKVNRGLAALVNPPKSTGGPKLGRPVGAKDKKPRKPRSDKGKKRGPYKKRKQQGPVVMA